MINVFICHLSLDFFLFNFNNGFHYGFLKVILNTFVLYKCSNFSEDAILQVVLKRNKLI